jgi:energy-coupling factor transport system permease protein
MTIFTYNAYDTPIHRLNPFIKVFFLIVLSLGGSYMIDPRWKLPLLLIVILLGVIAKLPFRKYLGLLALVTVMMLLATGYQSLFLVNPEYFKVYPKELVSQVLFNITPEGFPVIGQTALTVGSLIWLARLPLAGVTGMLLLATFLHTTSLNDIVHVMSLVRAPYPAIYIAMVAFRFAPDLAQQMKIIQTAQKLRGWSAETRNPFKKVKLVGALLIPMARHTIKCIDIMTISVQNRGFGAGRVTGMRPLTLKPIEIVVLIFCALGFAILLFGIFRLNWANI